MAYTTDRSKAVPPLSPLLFVCGVCLFYITSSLNCNVSCFVVSAFRKVVVFTVRVVFCVFVIVGVVLHAVFPDHFNVFYMFTVLLKPSGIKPVCW